jgi:L-histidine Nalpha-methyltransferase
MTQITALKSHSFIFPTESRKFSLLDLGTTNLIETNVPELKMGLSHKEHLVPTIYFYDDIGSKLFEKKCNTEPSYYLPRVETALLTKYSSEIVDKLSNRTLVELGSGNSAKTEILLNSFSTTHRNVRYCPIDINRSFIEKGGCHLIEKFPNLQIEGIAGTYNEAVSLLAGRDEPMAFMFLGSSMAQFTDDGIAEFVEMLRMCAKPGDTFLVAFDLYKDPEILAAPYNKPIACEYQRNGLTVINRLFDGNFAPEAITPIGRWNHEKSRIEMTLQFLEEQSVTLKTINFHKKYEKGEETITQIMRKMRPDAIISIFKQNGLSLDTVWRHSEIDYGLFLFKF